LPSWAESEGDEALDFGVDRLLLATIEACRQCQADTYLRSLLGSSPPTGVATITDHDTAARLGEALLDATARVPFDSREVEGLVREVGLVEQL
jgi:hypothetical protein